MKHKFILSLLFSVLSWTIGWGQVIEPEELTEIKKGLYKIYDSDGSGRAFGLPFSIMYPNSYQLMPADQLGTAVGFAKSVMKGGGFRVMIDKLPKGWEETMARKMGFAKEDAKAFLLSEKFFRGQMSEETKFLNYKSGFILAGENAAFFDYLWKGKVNVGDEIVEIMTIHRIYTLYYKEYEIKLVFTRNGVAEDEQEIKKEFGNYKEFFSLITQTFTPKDF